MKFWMAQEYSNSIACSAGKRLIYGSIAPDVQQLFTTCVSTTSHLLQLWASKPSVLQGSSSAARELTSVLLLYVGLEWQEASLATARRQILQPGFLSAYTVACQALAAALDRASAAEVPRCTWQN
ncbi:hypothetical protein OEZ86_010996 [Tetradesmus obliquus]|nr:hypothetical protein OEZ86_010996 [Tetradesmus obliquus]